MRIRVKKLFKYTWDNKTNHQLLPGEYDVPGEVAENTALLAIQFGAAVRVHVPAPKKEVPENKVVYPPANKKKVSKKKVKRKK